jgi:hypothetical protein
MGVDPRDLAPHISDRRAADDGRAECAEMGRDRCVRRRLGVAPVSVSLEIELSYDDIYNEIPTRSQEGFNTP